MITAGSESGWVLAKNQTAGRGSRGRNWQSPEGNFSASLFVRPSYTPRDAVLRSFTAALALADCFETLGADPKSVSLKWPNDVLLGGKKCAGILLESSGSAHSLDYLILGIGINLVAAPPQKSLPPNALEATTLAEHTATPNNPEQVLDLLAPAFERWETILQSEGFEPVKTKWLVRAAGLDQVITMQTGTEQVTGRIETLDDTGALVLKTASGPRTISAGEIYFPQPSHES